MRRFLFILSVLGAGASLSGCETAGYNEGPVEYAVRPDYRDVYRRPPPPIYQRYDRYDDYYGRPPPPPRPYYGGYRPYDDGY